MSESRRNVSQIGRLTIFVTIQKERYITRVKERQIGAIKFNLKKICII